MPGRVPSEQEVLGYFQECSNWGRWGPEDQRGTLNHITPQKRREAAALVRDGLTVSCGRSFGPSQAPDVTMSPLVHFMVSTGERWAGKPTPAGEMQSSGDFFGLVFHTSAITHLDALGHIFRDGKMYNGFPSDRVSANAKCSVESVEVAKDGIATRGVLLDIPRLRGVKWLERGEPIFPEDLEAAEKAAGVRVQPGDALLVRTGNLRRRGEEGPVSPLAAGWPGLHAACLPWLHRRQVALLSADVGNDVRPSGYHRVVSPIHEVGLTAMGLWLLDGANLEELTEACQRAGRWEFLFIVSPLRLVGGTGSPVNPIALL